MSQTYLQDRQKYLIQHIYAINTDYNCYERNKCSCYCYDLVIQMTKLANNYNIKKMPRVLIAVGSHMYYTDEYI